MIEFQRALGSICEPGTGSLERLKFGVPWGGPFDEFSYQLASFLGGKVINEFATTVSESLALTGEAKKDCSLIVTGAEGSVNGTPIPCRIPLVRGEEFNLIAGSRGSRFYISASLPSERLRLSQDQPWHSVGSLRFVPIDQSQTLDNLKVLHNSNRVGIRLSGAEFASPAMSKSEPSVFGAIQSTPDGTLLIHGPDGPTIGGYKKVGVVCQADLSRIGQLRIGEIVNFVPITLEEARKIRKSQMADFSKLLLQLRQVI